jgi:hypothetical protein
MSRILHAGAAPSILDEYATQRHQEWQWLLDAGEKVGSLPGTAQWVEQARSRIVASIPASGDDLEPLLKQIGLTSTLRGRVPAM